MDRILGKQKLIKDISANAVQTIAVQVFGILIFYFTSKYLPKDQFGDLNWSMATCATAIAICSLGLDLIFVKKVASGENVLMFARIHLFHTVLTGVFLIVLTGILTALIYPGFGRAHPVFLFVLASLSLSNIANSFKLGLNGLESYGKLARISVVANSVKLLLILAVFLAGNFSVLNVTLVFILTSLAELILSYYFLKRELNHKIRPALVVTEYKYFILESLPQLGVVLFDSALARIDWILLGIIGTAAVTAEYSFAYKIFEISKLPMLIIAPVLLTRFSNIFKDNEILASSSSSINLFFRIEMFVIMLIPVFLVVTWSPIIDFFTDGKYGAANETTFLILSGCVPMHAVINFLWTIGFVKGRLKPIMVITIIVSVINVVFNLLLIPYYAGEGAALAFLLSTITQLILYIIFIRKSGFNIRFAPAVFSLITAVVCSLGAKLLINNLIFAVIASLLVYTAIHFVFRLIDPEQIKKLLTAKQEIQ